MVADARPALPRVLGSVSSRGPVPVVCLIPGPASALPPEPDPEQTTRSARPASLPLHREADGIGASGPPGRRAGTDRPWSRSVAWAEAGRWRAILPSAGIHTQEV
ncbi:hypothetical protein GCM10009665_10600 [Kitasatospora nipponensis]|uniref:Uncharacterized protein n=1 Tax=Kitasatospora nipponensis TaxID=258049 RepID=A0ABN1VWL8_9ACTN